MTLEEKLQFITDRIKDEKEFSIGDELAWYRFINRELRRVGYLGQDRTEAYELSTTPLSFPLSLNFLLFSPLKLKPQWVFTEDEKVILRNLPERYKWIARDEHTNTLTVYEQFPSSVERFGGAWCTLPFKHLFQSIQWSDEPCEFRKYL